MLCLLEEAVHVRCREHPLGALGADHLEDRGEALLALHHERHPQQILVAERLDAEAERRLVEVGDEPPHGDVLAVGSHRGGHRDDGVGCNRAHHLDGAARIELGGKPREEVDREALGDLGGATRIEQASETCADERPERTFADRREGAHRQQPGGVSRALQQLPVVVVEQIGDGLAVVAQFRGRNWEEERERLWVFDAEQATELGRLGAAFRRAAHTPSALCTAPRSGRGMWSNAISIASASWRRWRRTACSVSAVSSASRSRSSDGGGGGSWSVWLGIGGCLRTRLVARRNSLIN